MDLTIRTRIRDKSLRITMPDQTWVLATFSRKDIGKSLVTVTNGRLPDKAAAERARKFWGGQLRALQGVLEG